MLETYTEENIVISNGEYDIHAVLTLPTEIETNVPMVVMLHGTASDKNEAGNGYAMYAPKLAENGIGSIRFDFIGTGDSTVDYQNYSFTSAIADTNTVIDYIKSLSTTNVEEIGIMGWSQGGTIAMLVAGENSSIKSMVLWAGAIDYTTTGLITDEDYAAAQENGYAVVEFAWRDSLNFGLDWYNEALNTDILAIYAQANVPTLAIAGSLDDVVLPEYADQIIENAQNETSQVGLVEGADHTFNIFTGDLTKFEETCDLTTNGFLNTLVK